MPANNSSPIVAAFGAHFTITVVPDNNPDIDSVRFTISGNGKDVSLVCRYAECPHVARYLEKDCGYEGPKNLVQKTVDALYHADRIFYSVPTERQLELHKIIDDLPSQQLKRTRFTPRGGLP